MAKLNLTEEQCQELNALIDKYRLGPLTAPDDTKRVEEPKPDITPLLQQAYRAGWDASGEGWNGEYPTKVADESYAWESKRNRVLAALMDTAKEATNADHFTYSVTWSQKDQEYVGTCDIYPSLSHLAETPTEALVGIRQLVQDVVKSA